MATSTLPTRLKRCNACGREKPASSFWRRAASADGLATRCIPCAEVARARRERQKRALEDAEPEVPSFPADPEARAALRALACVWWSLPAGLTQGELDNYAEIVWGLVCDPDYPDRRAAYETAMGGVR